MSVVERAHDAASTLDSRWQRLPGARHRRDGRAHYWWVEILTAVAFYVVYSGIRNARTGQAALARRNAHALIDFQQALGIYHEKAIQAWALHIRPLIIGANYFYGSLHFVVTIGVMAFLYRRFTDDYARWRNALAWATGLALVGFVLWPLMPPRLLPGAGFVDTLAKDPAIWSFNSGAMSKVSNQFAAMPSVHCAWALWCACALVPRLRRPWAKALAALYPVATVTAIVVTGNHYFLDAVGGFAALGAGWVISGRLARARERRVAVAASVAAPSLPLQQAADHRAQHG